MTNLTIEIVGKGLLTIALNYSLEIPTLKDSKENEIASYLDIFYSKLKEKQFTKHEFFKAVNGIIDNEKDMFGKMPSFAMFLQYTGKLELTLEKQAQMQVERILEESTYPRSTLFDNEFTNSAVQAYGGIRKIYYDCFDKWNSNILKERHWIKKELTEIWLNCQADNKRKSTPSIVDGQYSRINFVGDEIICQKMIDEQKKLEAPNKINKIIAKIGNR